MCYILVFIRQNILVFIHSLYSDIWVTFVCIKPYDYWSFSYLRLYDSVFLPTYDRSPGDPSYYVEDGDLPCTIEVMTTAVTSVASPNRCYPILHACTRIEVLMIV